MNYEQIRDRAVERMSEYQGGVAESDGTATIADSTIYARINDVMGELYHEAHEEDPSKFATTATMSYTADAESVILPSAVRTRPLVGVEFLSGVDYLPLRHGSNRQREDYLGQFGRRGTWTDERLFYATEGDYIALFPVPSSTTTLRLRYVPALTEIDDTDAADSPTWLPAELHAVIALGVALSFKRETDVATALEREYAQRREKLRLWAASSPHNGPRYVRE